MDLAAIKNHIYKNTKTTSTDWGTSLADMVIAANNANEEVLALIRGRSDNFYPTDWTTSDFSTGTAVPKFDALFHELVPLIVEHGYWLTNDPKIAVGIERKINTLKQGLTRFYGSRLFKICTVTIASPGVFTRPAHGLRAGDRIILSTTGALPTGLSTATWYYVISGGLTEDEFEISSTKTGSAINTSSSQSGTHYFATDTQGRIRPSRESNK